MTFVLLVVLFVLEVDVAANLDKMDRSDICNLCATGGMRANVAGSLDTSLFISDNSSSNWFSTCVYKYNNNIYT